MSELGQPFLKKIRAIWFKGQFGSNEKLGLESTMNGLRKPFTKISDLKYQKTVKIKVKLPHVNKKPLARKRIFVQTSFSHSTLNLERNSRRENTRFFAPLPVSA